MALSVNLTVSMPPEMAERIDEEADKRGISRAKYIRSLIREAETSPFEVDEGTELKA